ncbi:phosphatase PAP2 family protein [Rhizobium sp. CFBP 8762]|uniref:phosphatase PAP2 family protein n=1 Tax=Rhizobium sp. CFBP 8762 TaxID=2775279 RepID=UPI00178137FF|nr:phosphatase PAP2 family protein [Rhizobium sp. CFBP 8762]MBD8556729.1 phosphatase PAP2 family protein [Rhizobium sp. CFBP 8762]
MKTYLVSSGWFLLVAVISVGVLLPFDGAISQFGRGLPDWIVGVNTDITDFGTFSWMIYGSALLTLMAYLTHELSDSSRLKVQAKALTKIAFYFFLTTGLATIVVHGLKIPIGRARPDLYSEYGPYYFLPFVGDWLFESFPSGHSTAVGAFFGAFAMLFPRYRWGCAVLALIFGISRIIVGAHYPSDVAAGLTLGAWSAMTMAFILAQRLFLFVPDLNGWPVRHPLVSS